MRPAHCSFLSDINEKDRFGSMASVQIGRGVG